MEARCHDGGPVPCPRNLPLGHAALCRSAHRSISHHPCPKLIPKQPDLGTFRHADFCFLSVAQLLLFAVSYAGPVSG